MQDLIGFVQTHARTKREDLAGEVLALFLREQPGQMVIRSLIEGIVSTEDPIEVITQRTSAGCVPDIHLVLKGKTVGLLELKFGAPLTEHQLSGKYFEVAPTVVFIAPEERLLWLKDELSSLTSKHSLVLLSWTKLLSMLEKADTGKETREGRLFLGALEHLKEFCSVIEQERFDPFTKEQLGTPVQDGFTQHLVWLIREVLATATAKEVITEAGRLGAGFDSFSSSAKTYCWALSVAGWATGLMPGSAIPHKDHCGSSFMGEMQPCLLSRVTLQMGIRSWATISHSRCPRPPEEGFSLRKTRSLK